MILYMCVSMCCIYVLVCVCAKVPSNIRAVCVCARCCLYVCVCVRSYAVVLFACLPDITRKHFIAARKKSSPGCSNCLSKYIAQSKYFSRDFPVSNAQVSNNHIHLCQYIRFHNHDICRRAYMRRLISTDLQ